MSRGRERNMHIGLANPMCMFLGCHPECSEGSQVFAGIADEDMKSIPT